MILTESRHLRSAAVSLAVTAGLLSLSLFAVAAVRVDRFQKNHVLLQTIAALSHEPQVAALGRLEPSWVFYGQRPIRFMGSGQMHDAASFIDRGANYFLITTDTELRRLRPHLAADVSVLASVPYFLKESRLVLIGRASKPALIADPRVARPHTRH